MNKFKIGDTVIPFQKTTGGTGCTYFNKIRSGQIDFLYVVGFTPHNQYILNENPNSIHGNFYNETDLKPYIVDEELLFDQLVKGKISEDYYRRTLIQHRKRG